MVTRAVTLQQAYDEVRLLFQNGRLESSGFEAGLLIEHVFGIERSRLVLLGQQPAGREEYARLQLLANKRLEGYPIQYILGSWAFYGRDFFVGPGVLIPRGDSETLIDAASRLLQDMPGGLRIVDLCSGSGCIAITLACLFPSAEVVAAELYPEAYRYLEQNIQKHGAVNVTPFMCNVLEPSSAFWERIHGADIIVCNPPYIKTADIPALQREVAHEPLSALDGAEDGLRFYRVIPPAYRALLRPGGHLVFEAGFGQAEAISILLQENDYRNITRVKDLSGVERVVYARRE